jgi:hypothetical protein
MYFCKHLSKQLVLHMALALFMNNHLHWCNVIQERYVFSILVVGL